MTNEQKIAHVALNVMVMNAAMYYVYFGKSTNQVWRDANVMPGSSQEQMVNALKDHVTAYMTAHVDDIDSIYDEIKANGDLKIDLPE